MCMSDEDKDWKLKLRYGKLKTPFQHFTVIADGIVLEEIDKSFNCRPGRAYIGIKLWAPDADEAGNMVIEIGRQLGFQVDGDIQVYGSEPEEPPRDSPYGYDPKFTSY